jgi:serine/threonine protein kinase
MDFSLLSDQRAPWHGHQGYVGTDNYRSPEHMTRGRLPGLASDVFTCGLMLYECWPESTRIGRTTRRSTPGSPRPMPPARPRSRD